MLGERLNTCDKIIPDQNYCNEFIYFEETKQFNKNTKIVLHVVALLSLIPNIVQ